MQLLVSLVTDAIVTTVLVGVVANIHLVMQWWKLPRRWSLLRQPRWVGFWRWGWTLLLQSLLLLAILRPLSHPSLTRLAVITFFTILIAPALWIVSAFLRYMDGVPASGQAGSSEEHSPPTQKETKT